MEEARVGVGCLLSRVGGMSCLYEDVAGLLAASGRQW